MEKRKPNDAARGCRATPDEVREGWTLQARRLSGVSVNSAMGLQSFPVEILQRTVGRWGDGLQNL